MAQIDRKTFERLRDGRTRAEGAPSGGVLAGADASAWDAGSGRGGTLARLRLGEVPRGMLVAVALLALVAVALGAVLLGSGPKGVVIVREDASSAGGQDEVRDASQDAGQDEAPQPSLRVHVAGAVCSPGVYGLQEGARVMDAVEAAGGFAPDADPDALNLAQPVSDGCKVSVPYVGQAATSLSSDAGAASMAAAPASGAPSAGLVNINTADAATLQGLPGVGEAIAAEIVRDREAYGAFASPEDLMRVSGIGEKKFEALSALVTV